jgi:23S rRNA pseudouridine2604 synthase
LRAGNNHEKEYVVTVNKPLTDAAIIGMATGVPMLGITTKKCKITQEGPKTFRIILVQGLNRQIRRMCEHYNYEVTKLERVRIMHISLKGIPVGEWRELTESEMKEIYRLTEDSSSEVIKPTKNQLKQKNTDKKKKTAINHLIKNQQTKNRIKATVPKKNTDNRTNQKSDKPATGNRFAKTSSTDRFKKTSPDKRTAKPKPSRTNNTRSTTGKKTRR